VYIGRNGYYDILNIIKDYYRVILEKIYCLCLKMSIKNFLEEISSLTSPVHNYQDEKCTCTTWYKNKNIWQNTFHRFGLVIGGKKRLFLVGELLFF
jgi:hypothetical protein